MKMRRSSASLSIMAFGVLTLAVTAVPAATKVVDPDENKVENCTDFLSPTIAGLFGRVGTWKLGRPRLGISVDVTQSRRYDARGALVTDVMEDGPSDEAGIKEGDVITRVDGQSLFEPLPADVEEDFDLDESVPVQRLLAIARELEPGQEVEVEYLRADDTRTATVAVEDLSSRRGDFTVIAPNWDAEGLSLRMRDLRDRFGALDLRPDADADESQDRMRDRSWSFRFDRPRGGGVTLFRDQDDTPDVLLHRFGRDGGLEMTELNEGLGEYFGTAEGVLITDVHEDSMLGLEPGDVILSVGDRVTTSPDQVRRILRSYDEDEEITFRIRRDGREINVAGRLGG